MGFFSKIKRLWKGKEKQEVKDKPVKEESKLEEQSSTQGEQLAATVAAGEEVHKQRPEDLSIEKDKDWETELKIALQQAEPKLSVWLDILLKDVQKADDLLWDRLFFLFENLEVPSDEAEDFINRFKKWLNEMEYSSIYEFRSELQYRLALALDLEDEEDEQSRLFLKLSQGLAKTKEQFTRKIDALLQRSSEFGEEFWEELEEILIMADVGFNTTVKLVDRLKTKVRENNINSPEEFKAMFKEELAEIIPKPRKKIKPIAPEVVLMLGVNGVGKTTTIAKLAHRAQMQGRRVLLAAADTFRAAAIEQLEIWSKRVGTGFYAKESGADPAAVAYEAINKAKKEGYDLMFVDTAGRLHTKINLMEELKKIKRVLNKQHPGAPHRTILVLDATTGQNAISQVKLFNEEVGVDEIILTKLDGTAKGGVILGISVEFDIPITFVGLGEKMEDLRPFDPVKFADALLG
ncbi:signal recognition particle-docking protein FtsY [Desulfothermus okinawensis JCM 13304]